MGWHHHGNSADSRWASVRKVPERPKSLICLAPVMASCNPIHRWIGRKTLLGCNKPPWRAHPCSRRCHSRHQPIGKCPTCEPPPSPHTGLVAQKMGIWEERSTELFSTELLYDDDRTLQPLSYYFCIKSQHSQPAKALSNIYLEYINIFPFIRILNLRFGWFLPFYICMQP